MPQQIIEYRCLLISPGDVTEERDALTKLVNEWNTPYYVRTSGIAR